MQRILSWLRQTTTVHGLAVLGMTAVLQITGGVSTGVVLAGVASSLVLLILPGQGDLAGKVGKLTQDAVAAAQTRTPAAVGLVAQDGIAIAGDLDPGTPVLPVVGAIRPGP